MYSPFQDSLIANPCVYKMMPVSSLLSRSLPQENQSGASYLVPAAFMRSKHCL